MTGNAVRRIRKQLRLTQREFARLVGVHTVTVAKWEAGMQPLSGPAQTAVRLIGASKDRRGSKPPRGTRKPR